MIAMALANEPDLLIADDDDRARRDDPGANPRPPAQAQGRVHMAMLLITHDLGIVRKMADRVCVKKGQDRRAGQDARNLRRPATPTPSTIASEPGLGNKGAIFARPSSNQGLRVWFISAVSGRRSGISRRLSMAIDPRSSPATSPPAVRARRLFVLAPLEARVVVASIVYLGDRIDGFDSKRMRPLTPHADRVQDPYGSLAAPPPVGDHRGGPLDPASRVTSAERDQRVTRALKEVGLDRVRRDRYPHEFSGGQRQRIAIARARCSSRNSHPRRADLGARRFGAGADCRSFARVAAAPQACLSFHQSRFEGRARACKFHHRASSRQGGGARPGADCVFQAENRLHQGLACRGFELEATRGGAVAT